MTQIVDKRGIQGDPNIAHFNNDYIYEININGKLPLNVIFNDVIIKETWNELLKTEPTCTANGNRTIQSTLTGNQIVRTIPALGHAFIDRTFTYTTYADSWIPFVGSRSWWDGEEHGEAYCKIDGKILSWSAWTSSGLEVTSWRGAIVDNHHTHTIKYCTRCGTYSW